MKISYAITTHNEVEEVKQLIPFVYEHKKEEDEIIVLDDFSICSTISFLHLHS